jgi:DNA-binding transcriptional regulator YiaG
MKYKSEICKVMHQDAVADFEVGAISEARLREYDEMCLVREGETDHSAENPQKTDITTPILSA